MVTGWHSEMENNEKVWYYFDSNGVMITGWKEIGSSWYYFASSGKMATSSWQKDSKGRYSYLKSNGVACVSEFYKIDGKYYYFDADGIMATSNVTVKGKTYIIKSSGEVTNY